MESLPAPRPRLTALLAVLLATLFLLATPHNLAPRALAQEEGEKKAEEGKAGEPAKNEFSVYEIFVHILKSVGIFFGIVLMIVSIALVTLCVLLVLELRMQVAVPPTFVEEFTDTVNRRKFKEAYEMAKEDPSFVARVLTAGMSRLQYGIEDAREASFSMLESVKASKEQLIVYLATIGTLGPLLGLVGTVFGMILAFMSLSKGDKIDPKGIADAISHALVITLLGIGLSLPAIFAHAVFKNRLIRITHDAGTVADDLLTQMFYSTKKAGAAATPSTPDVPPPTDNRVPNIPAIKPK